MIGFRAGVLGFVSSGRSRIAASLYHGVLRGVFGRIHHYSGDLDRLWLFRPCRAFASQTWISWLSGAWTARPWASGTSSAVGIDSMGRHGMRFQGTCSTCGSLPALGNWCLQFRSAQNLKWMWCIGNWLEAMETIGSTWFNRLYCYLHYQITLPISSPILSTSTAVNFFFAPDCDLPP